MKLPPVGPKELLLALIFCAVFALSIFLAGLIQSKFFDIAYMISAGVAIFVAADVTVLEKRNPYFRAALFGYGTPFFVGAIGRGAATYACLTV